MTTIRWMLAGFVALYGCGASTALAQDRPYRALFGGAAFDPTASQMLDASVSLAEAYDTNVFSRTGGGAPSAPALQVGGFFTALSTDLRYAANGRRAQLSVSLGTNLRYFQELNEVAALGHYLGVGFSSLLGQKTTVFVNEAVSYMPSYFYGLFAKALPPAVGEGVAPAANYAVSDRHSYTSTTNAGIGRSVGRRGSVDFKSGYRHTTFRGGATSASDLTSYDVGGTVGYGVARDLTLRLGYFYRQAQYSAARRPTQHDVGLGVDYNRPLSRSRRTRLGIKFGTSMLEAPPPGQTIGRNVRRIRAMANVLLTHQMGRTWSARAAYYRGAQFIEELSAPVFTDSVTITADGFLNRRTDVTTSVAYSSGNAFGGSVSPFETYTGNARLRIAMTRTLAAYAEYFYYFYDFSSAGPLVAHTPLRVDRNGVRVGLTFWVPIIRK